MSQKVRLGPKEIRRIRKQYTRKEFGRLLGITPQAIYLWETGRERPGGPARRLLGILKGQMRNVVLRWLFQMSV